MALRELSLLAPLALFGACASPSSDADVAYVVGAPEAGEIGEGVLESVDLLPFDGQTGGPVFIEAAALDGLDSETVQDLAGAYAQGATITVFDVSQDRLDRLVDALGIDHAHFVSRAGESSTGEERAQVYSLVRGPNRFEHFSHETNRTTHTSDEVAAVREGFWEWTDKVESDPGFQHDVSAQPELGSDGLVDILQQATRFGATKRFAGTDGKVYTMNPTVVSLWSEDNSSWYTLFESVYVVDWSSGFAPTAFGYQAKICDEDTCGVHLYEGPSPATADQPVTEQTVSVNVTVNGEVSYGTADGVQTTNSGAIFKDEVTTSLIGATITNQSNTSQGRAEIYWLWATQPAGTVVNLPTNAVFVSPSTGNFDDGPPGIVFIELGESQDQQWWPRIYFTAPPNPQDL